MCFEMENEVFGTRRCHIFNVMGPGSAYQVTQSDGAQRIHSSSLNSLFFYLAKQLQRNLKTVFNCRFMIQYYLFSVMSTIQILVWFESPAASDVAI